MQVGGQAVIEGVMMRAPDRVAVACRCPDGSIIVRQQPYRPIGSRLRILALPVLRGAVVLVESLVLGMQALTFSGDVAMLDQRKGNNGSFHDSLLSRPVPW